MQPKYRICALTKNKTNPAYIGAQIGAARLARKLGCEIEGFVPDKPDDIDQQTAQIHAAIATKPDAILISPVHATALNRALQKAVDAGIVLVFFVTSAEGIAANAFITSDNYALATGIAGRLVEHLGGRGKVAILDGLAQSPTSPPRSKAFRDVAAAHPGIELVATAAGNYQRAEGKTEMAKILAGHSKLDGVICANDIMALGALEALDEAGRAAAMVGMNAMPDAVKAIKAGRLLATVSYDALSLMAIALQAAIRILDGKAVAKVIELPAEIIDISNCDAWDRPYEERPLPMWDDVMGADLVHSGGI
jgi:ribose transport system substrate-binding protein